MFNILKKRIEPFHTFPNGVKVYKVPENKHHKIPAKKILSILEMYNYIALLGVDKYKKIAIDDYIKDTIRDYLDDKKKKSELSNIVTVIETAGNALADSISKITDITAMQFDCFYYLGGEDPYNPKENRLEEKAKLLKEYPLDTVFFFKNQDDIISSYGSILNGAIQIVALQSALVAAIQNQESPLMPSPTKTK
jgi:hypothetical protein